jgi:hypothetical protein
MKITYKVISGIHILRVGNKEIVDISVHNIFDILKKGAIK